MSVRRRAASQGSSGTFKSDSQNGSKGAMSDGEASRTPLMVNAVYLILLGLATLTPSLTTRVFGYGVKDPGVLLVLSGIFFGYGVVIWSIASDAKKYGGLTSAQVVALAIGIVFLIWGWVRGDFTPRNVLAPLIINILLAGWMWSARLKA